MPSVSLREVGPRDGFQNEPEVIATDAKVRLVDMLAASGLRRLEVTSFVRPDRIPQLSDAKAVLAGISVPCDVEVSVLVPNEAGLDNAMCVRDRFSAINCFVSASETHNEANLNRSITESLAGLGQVIKRAKADGLRCQATISTSFGCPYEGVVPLKRVFEIAHELVGFGASEIAFGDTTGMANPLQVDQFFRTVSQEFGAAVQLTAHFHNTRGQGLANVLAAFQAGCRSFESSFGELGGCPVPPGATGNIATEDLVSMLHEMQIETGVDLVSLLGCTRALEDVLGRPLGSHTAVAGPVEWQRD